MIVNRLEKNFKKLQPWADRNQLEAYRLYDRDIPEFPYIVDKYGDYLLVYDKSDLIIDKNKGHLPVLIEGLKQIFKLSNEDQIVVKARKKKDGIEDQYTRLATSNEFFTVRENQAQFHVNLQDYLDTGLFLDHRPLRQWIYKAAKEKTFLNLFCYTGSVSVFAALGGARTTSIDMSGNYLDWAVRNFELNNINLNDHQFINTNVIEYLESQNLHKFDMIFLDPPTFSNSKKMRDFFEVEKDQEFLVTSCMKRLQSGGVLYFSNNKRDFKISSKILESFFVKDVTKPSIPQDYHDQKIHHCFEIRERREPLKTT